MRLTDALVEGSPLRRHLGEGLQALRRKDVALIAAGERLKVGDSLDLDAASHTDLPQAHRWDYLLSVPPARSIVGLEPHPATDSQVKVVIAKKNGARAYLRAHLKPQCHVSRWYWVTRGKVGFSRMEKARRLLDQNGIEFCGRALPRLP
jgi:hypothetical protein